MHAGGNADPRKDANANAIMARAEWDANAWGALPETAPPLASISDPGVRLIRGSLDRGEAPPAGEAIRDIRPVAGTLLLFDSVAVPHEVLAVTAERPRVACTGWFHELLPAP